MIRYNLLDRHNEIAHFSTSRQGGVSVGNYASFNPGPYSGDDPKNYTENQRILCQQLGIGTEQLILPFQTHGTEVKEINDDFFQLPKDQKTEYLHGVDALLTRMPNICIGITTADCVPLLFFDPVKQVVAAAHAGWRGTCGRIAEKTVAAMQEKYHCNPTDILAAIGPSISADVYEVGSEVIAQFRTEGFDMDKLVQIHGTATHLDLWEANRQSLSAAGILPTHIETAGICTYTHHHRFFSARRLGIKSGRIVSGIMLK